MVRSIDLDTVEMSAEKNVYHDSQSGKNKGSKEREYALGEGQGMQEWTSGSSRTR